jgi:hypothetical protein
VTQITIDLSPRTLKNGTSKQAAMAHSNTEPQATHPSVNGTDPNDLAIITTQQVTSEKQSALEITKQQHINSKPSSSSTMHLTQMTLPSSPFVPSLSTRVRHKHRNKQRHKATQHTNKQQ